MRARTTLVAVALVVASMAAVPATGLAASGDQATDAYQTDDGTTTNETEDGNASVAPGERLSGVVGVQEAELEGEVYGRAFGLRVARAATNDSKAGVVGEQVQDLKQRLDGLRERKQELNESRANGSVSEGRYRAEVAELAARTKTVKELANRSENASQGLPAELLESKGINATAIQTLKDRASELSGPQVAKIARSIGGPGAAPGDRGPGDRPGQAGPPGNGSQAGPPESSGEAGPSEGPGQRGEPGNSTAGSGQQTDAGGTPTADDDNPGNSEGNNGNGGGAY